MFVVRGEVSPDAITASLQALLPTRHHPIVRRRLTLLDTFDGRVRRAGARLTRRRHNGSGTITWQRRGGGTNFVLRLGHPVSFVWDLPDGPLQQAVAPVVGVRRLFAQAELEVYGSLLDILDDHKKTIARLRIESGRARLPEARHAWQSVPCLITLTSLRGYEDVYHTLVPVIESRPGVEACSEGFDGLTLRQLGALIPDVPLPGADLEPTVLRGYRRAAHPPGVCSVLLANEPGLRSNLDTEFLHDFRVAIRRTRSLLGQIRHVFPPDVAAALSTEFSWLGRLTGPPRDMDVLLLSLRLAGRGHPGRRHGALIALLGQAQEQEHQPLIEALDSERYRRLLTDWGDVSGTIGAISSGGAQCWTSARRRCRAAGLAAEPAHRPQRETFDEQTPAEQLHELRLDAKKLRYLIDVTPSFYDAADLERILSALKKLQRVLGDFNDAQVQERRLLECGRTQSRQTVGLARSCALGRLADACRQRRERLRGQVADGLAGSATTTRDRRAGGRSSAMRRSPPYEASSPSTT